MIFTMDKGALVDALALPAKLASKSLVAFTSCVHVAASGTSVAFEATNFNESVKRRADALVEESGEALIPAARLASIVKEMPDMAITVQADAETATVKYGGAHIEIPSLDPQDFPAFPDITSEVSFSVSADALEQRIKKLLPFTSKDPQEKKEQMRGIYVECSGDTLTMASTDSYRIASISADADGAAAESSVCTTLPAALCQSILGTKCNGDVKVSWTDLQIKIEFDDTVLIARAIVDEYPNWKPIVKRKRATVARVDKDAALGAFRRAATVCSNSESTLISVTDDSITVSATSNNNSSISETFAALVTGGAAEIYINARYMVEALSSAEGEEYICIVIDDVLKPLNVEDECFTCTVMPVRR